MGKQGWRGTTQRDCPPGLPVSRVAACFSHILCSYPPTHSTAEDTEVLPRVPEGMETALFRTPVSKQLRVRGLH